MYASNPHAWRHLPGKARPWLTLCVAYKTSLKRIGMHRLAPDRNKNGSCHGWSLDLRIGARFEGGTPWESLAL